MLGKMTLQKRTSENGTLDRHHSGTNIKGLIKTTQEKATGKEKRGQNPLSFRRTGGTEKDLQSFKKGRGGNKQASPVIQGGSPILLKEGRKKKKRRARKNGENCGVGAGGKRKN